MPGDPNKYLYGNDPNGAANEAGKLTEQGRQGQFRQGEQINTQNADAARQQAQGARGGQVDMASLMRARAMGATPSIAGMRANQDMTRVAAEQSSAQASARGPAGLALAQQGAAANTAAAQSNISNSAQINSAVERQQAEQAAFGAQSQIRAGDQGQQGQDFSQGLAQSQLNQQQRAQNDQYQLANQGQAQGVQGMQLGANMNQDAADRSDYWNQQGLEEQKRARDESNIMGAAGIGASVLGTVGMMSDENAKMPVNFGRGGAAPEGMGYGVSTQDAAPGYDTDSVTMAKLIAHRALDEQTQRENAAQVQDHTTGGGPMAYDGVEALKRRDNEDLGLMKAKERNGIELSEKEQASKGALSHRVGTEKPAKADAARAMNAKEVAATEKPGAGAQAGAGLQALGKSVTGMAQSMRPTETWKPSAPTHYAMPQPAAPVTWSDEKTKKPARKMSMAELMKAADAMRANTDAQRSTLREGPATEASSRRLEGEGRDISDRTEAQRAMLDAGPSVGGDRLEREGRAMAEHTDAQRSMLDAGPSVGSHEDTGAEDYDRRGRGMRTTSDDHAKVALAQREAFTAGLAHANEAADTGKIPEAPEYMREKPSVEKRNTTAGDRRAAAMSKPRQDPSSQRAAVRDSSQNLARAAIMSSPVMPISVQLGSDLMRDDVEGQSRAMRDRAMAPSPPPAAPPTTRSDERAKVGHLGLEMSHSDMAEAARSMRAVPYAYKPEYAGQERQQPGEVNVGPVAQEMQKSPVAATAVKQDSPNGLRQIDLPKFTKVLGGIVASQQEEIDDLKKSRGSFMARRIGGKR